MANLINGDYGNCMTYAKSDLDRLGPCTCFDCEDQLPEDTMNARRKVSAEYKEYERNRK